MNVASAIRKYVLLQHLTNHARNKLAFAPYWLPLDKCESLLGCLPPRELKGLLGEKEADRWFIKYSKKHGLTIENSFQRFSHVARRLGYYAEAQGHWVEIIIGRSEPLDKLRNTILLLEHPPSPSEDSLMLKHGWIRKGYGYKHPLGGTVNIPWGFFSLKDSYNYAGMQIDDIIWTQNKNLEEEALHYLCSRLKLSTSLFWELALC